MGLKTKNRKNLEKIIYSDTYHSSSEAFAKLKEVGYVKFDESVDVAVNLGIDGKKSDQNVRGATVLPHGTGKTVRVAVFAQAENADKAKAAGADIVGFDDLAESIQKGEVEFDVVIATPDAMRVVGKLGQVLGPRGLMPNPKVGTVTTDIEAAVTNAKGGQVRFRADKSGIVHCSIGKASFSPDQLKDNLNALLGALEKAKPSSAKGIYLKKVSVSSTMGPSFNIDKSRVND